MPLYPCIGLRSTDEEIEANFGQQPFLFDFEAERNVSLAGTVSSSSTCLACTVYLTPAPYLAHA